MIYVWRLRGFEWRRKKHEKDPKSTTKMVPKSMQNETGGAQGAPKGSPCALLAVFLRFLGVSEGGRFLMRFLSGKKSAQNRKNRTFSDPKTDPKK